MKVTIDIPDKEIKEIIDVYLDNNLYECYDDDVLDYCKVPDKKTLLKEILADEKAQASLIKVIQSFIKGEIDLFCLVDYDLGLGRAEKLRDACDKVEQAELEKAREARKEKAAAEELDLSIQALRKAGYKVTKA